MRGKGRQVLPLANLELSRDVYGFTVRPQHLQRYREYARIYKEEEGERSERWQHFLKTYVDSTQAPTLDLPSNEQLQSSTKDSNCEEPTATAKTENITGSLDKRSSDKSSKVDYAKQGKENHKTQTWSDIRPSLDAIERNLSFRIRKRKVTPGFNKDANSESRFPSAEDLRSLKVGSPASDDDSEEEFYDVERSDSVADVSLNDGTLNDTAANGVSPRVSNAEPCSWKEELESLVRGGVPMALRKELWQAFVGASTRRIENYYNELLMLRRDDESDDTKDSTFQSNTVANGISEPSIVEKWKIQIEKDLPRTFPGHPALDEDGRNALRRLLTAYARHNPSVGYCQAMNFFAGLLLLLMPEENAFWTLTGIIDDYFDGYYSEKMVESQVDQLVFEELVRECFPRLVAHLDNLGVQVAWVTGPWFLSIFVNVLPWESVLRVWDVLLYEGNRTMLFRTALALMELYGPALITTKDAGDAVTLLQSLAGSTFDSSQLVLTACMGYQVVDETRLKELRGKHRPTVLTSIEERSKEPNLWKTSRGLVSKLYTDKSDEDTSVEKGELLGRGKVDSEGNFIKSGSFEQIDFDNLSNGLVDNDNANSNADLQDQVKWLKIELCRALEEKRSATLRAEELETALVEMVKEDNRRLLSAKLEQLESEMENLRQSLVEKEEQEHAMLQVMMRVEQEQRLTEDARRFAEQDATAQRHAANVLEVKYEDAKNKLAMMEKRAIMAESTLEATLQSQPSQQTSSRRAPDSPWFEEPQKLSLPQNGLQRRNEKLSKETQAHRGTKEEGGNDQDPVLHLLPSFADIPPVENHLQERDPLGIQQENQKKLRMDSTMRLATQYFYGIFVATNLDGNAQQLLNIIPNLVSEEDTTFLLHPALEKELQTIVWAMKKGKIPGSDGFPIEFYQEFWDIIKNDLFELVEECRQAKIVLKVINPTYIPLVPKKEEALCNVLYKIITKVIAERLKTIINKVISLERGGFVPRRQIYDDIVLAQEALHSMDIKKKPAMFLRLGLSKAYDKLQEGGLLSEHLLRMKDLRDQLSFINKKVDDDDMVALVLNIAYLLLAEERDSDDEYALYCILRHHAQMIVVPVVGIIDSGASRTLSHVVWTETDKVVSLGIGHGWSSIRLVDLAAINMNALACGRTAPPVFYGMCRYGGSHALGGWI
ncbi:hypothetical protein KI387_035907 [Taxus chinensis]|uniref:Rab-GAP TBC domain-containing protein n=1 Tax=Taxus chinensis TaxID=29808 RepID=A0AA38FPC5_TAXCH|nr:hypothetical protein KI387_035907 [Taxus chinensis]